MPSAGNNECPPYRPDADHEGGASQNRLAVRSPLAIAVFILLAVGGLAADLWSKEYVFNSLLGEPIVEQRSQYVHPQMNPKEALERLHPSREILPGIMSFSLSTNPGVVFGMEYIPPAVVAVVSIVTIGVVFFFFASGPAGAWSMHVGLAFIMAGALGNLYDRLIGTVVIPNVTNPISHQVRDFIDFSAIGYPYIFNVADVLLVVGVGLLVLNWLLHRKDGVKKAAAKPA